MNNLLIFALVLGVIDYQKIESNRKNVAVQPPAAEARSMFTDATITRWWHDNEGIHLIIVRDRPLSTDIDASKWVAWTDGRGAPWLKRSLSRWEGQYWQSKEWRDWRFPSDESWASYWKGSAGASAPSTENHGVDQSKLTHSFLGGELAKQTEACGRTHEGPCPGPRCPLTPLVPPIQPHFPINLNVDPLVLGGIAIFAALVISILIMVLGLLLRRLFR